MGTNSNGLQLFSLIHLEMLAVVPDNKEMEK